jgi:hypothetical protein
MVLDTYTSATHKTVENYWHKTSPKKEHSGEILRKIFKKRTKGIQNMEKKD